MLVDARRPLHLTVGIGSRPHKSKERLLDHLRERAEPVKLRFAPAQALGITAALTADEASAMREPGEVARLREGLAGAGLYVAGVDGRSFAAPGGARAKVDLFAPDWRDPTRLTYTVDCAWVLAGLLGAGGDGAVSTTPLTFRAWVHPRDDEARRLMTAHLTAFAESAQGIFDATGCRVRLALEPAPGAALESVQDVIHFFGGLPDRLGARLRPVVGVSLDACSLGAAYETPDRALALLLAEGIAVNRVRLRSAIRIVLPSVVTARAPLAAAVGPYVGHPGFHQVMERHANDSVRYLGDLSAVSGELLTTLAREWRVAYPFPVHVPSHLGLDSTQRESGALLFAVLQAGGAVTLEVPAGERYREWSPADFRWALEKITVFRAPPSRRAA